MSIVDAIEKAKRLAKARAADEAPAVRRRSQAAAGSSRTVPVSPAPQLYSNPVMHSSPTESTKFELRAYDVQTCKENRLIIPEAEPALLQSAAPSYRMLRTRILQRCRTNNWTALGLTSPGPTEGKSMTAINLAMSIAREGNNDVFLIDLDMRNPSVSRYLGVIPPKDISEFFQGTAGGQDCFFSIGIPNLVLASSNMPAANASELLSSGRLEELFAYIRSVAPNPMILLDLPPIVNTDDALVVAPRVDAMVLIVSEGHTRRDGVETALGLLSEFTLAGVVLNQSMESLGSDYYGAQ